MAQRLLYIIFLGAEYLFDDMMAYTADSEGVVIAQSYILGASVIGFLLFPLANRLVKEGAKYLLVLICSVAGVVCIFLIQQHASYEIILISGLFQFINNNCVKNDMVQSIVLSAFIMIFLVFAMRLGNTVALKKKEDIEVPEKKYVLKNPVVAGGALIACVVLMTCVFSTLDNVVTLVHATGSVDIGEWPRLLLALSGLAAGFFVVFFTVGFMDLARHIHIPEF